MKKKSKIKKTKSKRKVAKKTKVKNKKINLKAKKMSAKIKEPKPIAEVEHFFGHINVAAFKLKAPLKIGDRIHIKGATTDFVQTIGSMQIEHESVNKAAKGKDVGIKVNSKCRVGDKVFVAAKEAGLTVQPAMFPAMQPTKKPETPKPAQKPQTQPKTGYENTKFMNF